jgi:hypothetical protein
MTRNEKPPGEAGQAAASREMRRMSYKPIVPQDSVGDSPLSIAFLVEALLACEEIWAALPGPAPLFARELLGALEIAERGEVLKSNGR